MRRPWRTTAGGWHTETHDPHAHHHHESSDCLSSGLLYEAVVVTYVIDFCRVGRVVYPSPGATPPNFQFSGTGVVAALQPVRKLGKTGLSLIFVWLFWFDCSFSTACPRVVTLTALQTAGAFVCAHDYRAVRTVQAAQPL